MISRSTCYTSLSRVLLSTHEEGAGAFEFDIPSQPPSRAYKSDIAEKARKSALGGIEPGQALAPSAPTSHLLS